MKLNWAVDGVVTYKTSEVEACEARWPALTFEEAGVRLTRLVDDYMRRRKVGGISVTASARDKNGAYVISEARWK